MNNRITRVDVRAMLARAIRAAQSVGLDTTNWTLQMGSKTNGVAYRLHVVDPDTGGHSATALMSSFLGMTALEAYDRLQAYAYAWEAASYVNGGLSR